MDASTDNSKEQQQIQDITRPVGVGLPVEVYDPSSRIQVQFKDLAYFDNAVKFLLGQQQDQAQSSVQLIPQPQNVQSQQQGPSFAITNIQNVQEQPLAQSELECVDSTLKNIGVFLPQEKKNVSANNDRKLLSDGTERSKFFSRKMKNIKANIDELHKKAGITAVTLFYYDGDVQFAGPDHMASLAENKAFKDIFLNAVSKNDAKISSDSSTKSKKTPIQEKTPALDWSCDECESSFATQHNLINHKLISHSNLDLHKCELCGKEFVDITVFEKHLTTHAEDNLFQCKICGNAFTAKNLLNTHMKVHNEEKRYSCKICTKSFHSSSSLQYHMNKHGTEKKYVCEHCKKEFTKMSSLKVHLRIHTGEQPYQCQECGKGFIVSTHLTRHLRVHSGERPYLCEVCGKRFNRSSHLRIHFRIHSGEKPYECEICGKKFNQTVSRKKHLKTHMK